MPDTLLEHWLAVATELVDDHVPTHRRTGARYDEALVALAVKISEVSARGTVLVDPSGEIAGLAPGATAGLVRSVWAYIGPLTATGGGGFA